MVTLKSLRQKAGLSQAELARRCGMRQATLSAIEGGRSRPQRSTVAALSAVLGVDVEEMASAIRRTGAGLVTANNPNAVAVVDTDWAFLAGLDSDLRAGLAKSLVAEWTHSSTAIEGNTISAGDTLFVLTEGLTVSGKSLREHQELHGHAQAIRLLAAWTRRRLPVGVAQLHELHRAVQTGAIIDSLAPVGAWKVEPNGTTAITYKGTTRWHEYAAPADVPVLMTVWIDLLTACCRGPTRKANGDIPAAHNSDRTALVAMAQAYTDVHLGFTAIHPYADGNGRMARLLANIPILRRGEPPLLIPSSRRRDYLTLMRDYSLRRGRPQPAQELVRAGRERSALVEFFLKQWRPSQRLVDEYRRQQRRRHSQAGAYESQAFEEALDACAHEPGAKYFERKR